MARAESFCFVVAGDTQSGQTYVDEIVQATIDEGADFILICGDLTNSGSVYELQQWLDKMQPLYDAGIGVYPVRGNHESFEFNVPKSNWDSVFSGIYALPGNGPNGEENVTYSFTHKTALVVGLDQFVKPYRNNIDWLEEQFALNEQPHVFVFGHTSAFNIYHADAIALFAEERNIFINDILAENGRVYFCGHDHFYDHIRLDNGDGETNNDLHQFLLNSDSKTYEDWQYYGDMGIWEPVRIDHQKCAGYMLVEINDLDVTLTWKYRTSMSPLEDGLYEASDIFEYTAIDTNAPRVNIPDPNLESAVNETLGITDADMDNILGLTYLDANSLGISDLTGLEYANNLKFLYLSNNFISRASSLTHLTNLEELDLNNNPLDRKFHCLDKPVIIQKNPGIDIRCAAVPDYNDYCVADFPDPNLRIAVENDLGKSPVTLRDMQELFDLRSSVRAGITNLSGLENATHGLSYNLFGNSIEDISVLSNTPTLVSLNLYGNRITDISALYNCTNLMTLGLGNNQISNISSLSNMANLEYVELRGNPLNTQCYCTDIPTVFSNNIDTLVILYDPNPNSLTQDCSTNFCDFAAFASHWLEVGCDQANNWCVGADIDHIDDVDISDLQVLAEYWLN
ncbi:MAG: metallophosphoesterase [Sedimentisphaerales bacterium]|nr:metallophosphoesterase [Sedimentisphaerales bacterium]